MNLKKTVASMAIAFIIFFALGAFGASRNIQADFVNQANPTPQVSEEIDNAIRTAMENKVQQNRSQALGFLIYEVVIDQIQYSNDQTTALVWLALRDPETGEIVASEPGLSIARNPNSSALANPDSWGIILQQENVFLDQLTALPQELLTEEIRNRFLAPPGQSSPELSVAGVLSGYKLPWTAGVSKRITNSIGHVYEVSGGLASCPATCRYAYDFADGTMFPLLASKGGTVKAYKLTCPNGGTDCTNYLVLEDQSTVPTTYQLYYHMANESIPTRLRTIGAEVRQGEYIGDVDDTGYSTGHHLHFHVYYTPTGTNWSWGNSVDFTYDDVSTNGGYPRTCSEASQYPNLGSQCMLNNLYVSGNTPANPPSATMASPVNRQVITGRTVRVSGTASDDIQIARIQVLVNYDGTWKSIDDIPPVMGNYAKDVDLCSSGIPDGPMGLTVRVYDREGSQAKGIPVVQMIKNSACSTTVQPPSPPACTPTSTQVALYAETDFRGACTRFNVNESTGYTVSQLGAVGDNNAASIQVGASVRAVLFDDSADVTATRVNGRAETIDASDTSLSNNAIGSDTVSGLMVISRTTLPDEPFINALGSQASIGANITSLDSLVLAWEGGAGATIFDVTLTGPGAGWTRQVTGRTDLSVGSLSAGSYTMTVQARNNAGTNTTARSFSVTSASFPAATALPVDYQQNFESGTGSWIASGMWRRASITIGGRTATQAWIFNDNTDYSTETWRAGDLTSPPIALPASGTYYLRFSYFADVEGGSPYWDQRRVQISDGGPFTDLHQLTDDRQVGQIWLNSGPINLAAYAGKTVRIRFHMDTVDEKYNSGSGWMVDDVTINSQAPNTSCADNDNNSPANALDVSLGGSVSGVICPERDVDFYRFSAVAGQPLLIDVNAKNLSPASQLDSYVFLLDSDGRNVLAENDDEEYGVMQDSMLSYTLQRAGTYYLKIRPWDYPGAGGPNHYYQIGFNQNLSQPPQSVDILYPPPSSRLSPTTAFDISASAVDFDGGPVARMDFYWHGPDWSKPEWVKLGSDTSGSNGWTFNINPALYGAVNGSAVYVQAVGRTGGVLGDVIWDLLPDQTTPISQMSALPGQINSTVVQLKWTASDVQNDIVRFDVQFQVNTGAGWSNWQNWTGRSLTGDLRSTWFSATAGASYRFRMRAVDRAGNQEPYPDSLEASTTFAASCNPDLAEGLGQTLDSAIALPRSTISPIYNLCKSGSTGAGDEDWVTVNAQAGEAMLFMLTPKGGGAAFNATLYNSSNQVVTSWNSADFERGLAVRWDVPAGGNYFLRIKPLQDSLFGTDTIYQVWYGPGNWNYLPIVVRKP